MKSADKFSTALHKLVNDSIQKDLSAAEIVGLLMLMVHKLIKTAAKQ